MGEGGEGEEDDGEEEAAAGGHGVVALPQRGGKEDHAPELGVEAVAAPHVAAVVEAEEAVGTDEAGEQGAGGGGQGREAEAADAEEGGEGEDGEKEVVRPGEGVAKVGAGDIGEGGGVEVGEVLVIVEDGEAEADLR